MMTSLLRSLAHKPEGVLIHDGKAYVSEKDPDYLKTGNLSDEFFLKGVRGDISYRSLGSLGQLFHEQKNNFKSLETFSKKVVFPILSMDIDTVRRHQNLFYSSFLDKQTSLFLECNRVFLLFDPSSLSSSISSADLTEVFYQPDGSSLKVKKTTYLDKILHFERKSQKSFEDIFSNNTFNVSYSFEKSDEVVFSKDIPSFKIHHKGNTYLFPKTTLSTNLQVWHNRFLMGRPYVSKGYHHPAVFSDGEICYNDQQRFNIKNLQENQFGNVTLHTAFQIAQLFNEARMNLKHGYQDGHPEFNPVKELNPCNFSSEYQGDFKK